jgi:aspartate dehydrogenase
MRSTPRKIKVGIVGCGAIGSRLAQSIKRELNAVCVLSALYDIDHTKSAALAKQLKVPQIFKKTLNETLLPVDLIVEAVSSPHTPDIIHKILNAKKHVLVVSVGSLIKEPSLFELASKKKCSIIVPSGAVAGIDSIKAAAQIGIDKITLVTRKPPAGLKGNLFIEKSGIDLTKIKKETVVFEGPVKKAIEAFPQNINVAATLSIASKAGNKLKVRIVTSPEYKRNMHEVQASGSFGKITTLTENVPCPDNPRSSYLAVLSAKQALEQYCKNMFIGT